MRWFLVIVLLADCGPSAARPTAPPANVSHVKPPPSYSDKVDPDELALLESAAGGELGPLSEHYLARGAMDEYSAVRERMLESLAPRPGPAPGGPFPRIGAPRTTARPATFLGRWINPTDLPELYDKAGTSTRQLEDRLRAELKQDPTSASTMRRLGDAMCARVRFHEAEALYEHAARAGDAKAKERLVDARRILHRTE